MHLNHPIFTPKYTYFLLNDFKYETTAPLPLTLRMHLSIQARKEEASESTGLISLGSRLDIDNTALSFERTLCKCSSRKRKK